MTRALAFPVALAGLLLALAAAPSPAFAADDFLDAYRAGLAAAEQGSWSAAAAAMRQAIAGRADEDARMLRLRFGSYIPHYHLGRALFELGDCTGALAAWEESERQGVIQRLDEHQRLQADRARCRERQAARQQAQEAVAAAEAAIRRAAESLSRADALGRRPEVAEDWDRGRPSPARRLADAQGRLDEARRELAEAQGTDRDAPGMREVARQARVKAGEVEAEGEALAAEAAKLLAAAETRLKTLVRDLGPLLSTARELLADTAYLAPYPREIGRLRSRLQALVGSAEAQQKEAGGSPAQVASLQESLEAGIRQLRQAAAPPPESLRRATAAFLQGAHEGVLRELLDDSALPQGRARAHSLLLRAAARHALYLRGGGSDGELLAAARSDLRACRRIDSTLVPPPKLFSPRFVDFFAAETAPAGGAESPDGS